MQNLLRIGTGMNGSAEWQTCRSMISAPTITSMISSPRSVCLCIWARRVFRTARLAARRLDSLDVCSMVWKLFIIIVAAAVVEFPVFHNVSLLLRCKITSACRQKLAESRSFFRGNLRKGCKIGRPLYSLSPVFLLLHGILYQYSVICLFALCYHRVKLINAYEFDSSSA